MTSHTLKSYLVVSRPLLIMLLWAITVAAAPSNDAQAAMRIGGWSLSANGQIARNFEYSGPCPVALKFDWGVVSSDAVEATYTFLRNDGATAPSRSVAMAGGGRSTPIYQGWQLGANVPEFSNYHGWEELVVESPSRLTHRINFTLHCGDGNTGGSGGGSVRIGGWAFFANGQIARDYQYTGPCPVALKFDWGVVSSEPTQITYQFFRNDGARGPSSTRSLPGGGRSESITKQWQLGASSPQFQNYSGWMELHTDPPHSLANKISFTLHCQ
jgi:hypothetical protein